MLSGKELVKILLYAVIFWLVIGGLIIIASDNLFETDTSYMAYDITGQKMRPKAQLHSNKSGQAALEHGALLFQQCAVCHRLGPEASSSIGPNLSHIIGRKIASAKDFYYSKAMQEFAGRRKSWSLRLLDSYLANPQGLVPGNRMGFYGIKNAQERADLLLYLYKTTSFQEAE